MRLKILILFGVFALLGVTISKLFISSKSRRLLETHEIAHDTAGEANSFLRTPSSRDVGRVPSVREFVPEQNARNHFSLAPAPVEKNDEKNPMEDEFAQGEVIGVPQEKNRESSVEQRIERLMDEMDAILAEMGPGMSKEVAEDRKLAIDEIEREIQEAMREAKIPSVTREGPSGWTIYLEEEEPLQQIADLDE